MGQGVDGDVKREFLAVFGAHAFTDIAAVGHAEGAAEAILAHHHGQVALVEQSFQVDILVFVQAADAGDDVKGAINLVIIREGAKRFVGKNPGELAPAGLGEIHPGAATGDEQKAAMLQIYPQRFQFFGAEDEIIMAVHEKERCLEQFRIGEPDALFLLELEVEVADFHSARRGEQLLVVLDGDRVEARRR